MAQKAPDDAIQHTQPVGKKNVRSSYILPVSNRIAGQHIPQDFGAMHT